MSNNIHPTAIVEDGATLGEGVKIGPYCLVSADAKLGDEVELLSHVVVAGRTICRRTLDARDRREHHHPRARDHQPGHRRRRDDHQDR